jgi:hypothetical protein
MKKYLIFTGIAISVPVIFSLDAQQVSMPKEIKPRFKTVSDWSKIKSPKKLKYYEHLYNTSK